MSLVNVRRVVTGGRFAQNLTVLRGSGYWAKGEFIEMPPATLTARGSWQRVSSDELRQLDMGDVGEEVRKLLTPTEIRISKNSTGMSDRIVWRGRVYRVLRVDDNDDYGFYRAYATYEQDFEGGEEPTIYLESIPILDDIPPVEAVPQ